MEGNPEEMQMSHEDSATGEFTVWFHRGRLIPSGEGGVASAGKVRSRRLEELKDFRIIYVCTNISV